MTGIHLNRGKYVYIYEDQFGQRRQINLGVRSYETAVKIASKFLGEPLNPERREIVIEVAQYIDERSSQLSKNWFRDNSITLMNWARTMHEVGLKSVQEIESHHLQRWFDQTRQRVKTTTAVSYLHWVKAFLESCVMKRRIILYNPAGEIEIPRHSRSVRRNFLRLSDVQKLIDNCTDPELRFAIYCGVHQGMRYEEVIMARPEWFDLDARLVHIMASQDWEPKDRENRTVPLTSEFAEFLEEYGNPGEFMIAPRKLKKGKSRYRFDFSKRFENYVRSQGVRTTFHDLRRTFASLRVSSGISPYKVAKWLGNSIEMVEKVYGHLIPNDSDVNAGVSRKNGQEPSPLPEQPAHRQLSWEQLNSLVWRKPMREAAKELGISDTGLKKLCRRMEVVTPPQGFWSTPPNRRAKFLERANRSHKGEPEAPLKLAAA
jgi:integrase